jgi:hypothetical protein
LQKQLSELYESLTALNRHISSLEMENRTLEFLVIAIPVVAAVGFFFLGHAIK